MTLSDVLAFQTYRTLPRKLSEKFRAFGDALQSRFIVWLVPALILLVWQAASSFNVAPPNLLPSPIQIVAAAWRTLISGELLRDVLVSFSRASAGLVIGGGLGLIFGLTNGMSKILRGLTDTTFQMARNIPHLAMVPLVILWFGIDESAKIFLVATGVFFPIYLNTLHGVRSVDPQLIEMAQSYGASRRDLFWLVILPGALPSIFVGLRYALGIMWLTLVVAETIGAESGLGFLAMQAREFMQLDVVMLAILIYALLGKLADSVARLGERKCLSWSPAYRT